MDNNYIQSELPLPVHSHFEVLPDDLFIPPNALEVCLESFSGPLDLLLYLIKKETRSSQYLLFRRNKLPGQSSV